MGISDKKDFFIKEDGTIVRSPNLKELRKELIGYEKDDANNGSGNKHDDRLGLKDLFRAFVVMVLICTVFGGIFGPIFNRSEGFELGLIYGGLFGTALFVFILFQEIVKIRK